MEFKNEKAYQLTVEFMRRQQETYSKSAYIIEFIRNYNFFDDCLASEDPELYAEKHKTKRSIAENFVRHVNLTLK